MSMISVNGWQQCQAVGRWAQARAGRATEHERSHVQALIHMTYRDFKAYYRQHWPALRSEFPGLVTYVEIGTESIGLLSVAFRHRLAFVDSTPVAVCHNKRIRNKSSMTRVNCWRCITPGNTDCHKLTSYLWGKLVGDRGYISQLFEQLFSKGLNCHAPAAESARCARRQAAYT